MAPRPPTTAHVHIPPTPPTSLPSHVHVSPAVHLTQVADAVARARRVVVVCGAGVSVAAGIPDFRSQDGLFRTLRDSNPAELLSSGKDLFDARVFQSPQTVALFNRTISTLSTLSASAKPTTFHTLLNTLDTNGKLLRVYTQNIDALEEKAGLGLGVPVWPQAAKRAAVKPKRGVKRKADTMEQHAVPDSRSQESTAPQQAGQAGTGAPGVPDDTASISISVDGELTPASTPRPSSLPLPSLQPPPNPVLNGLLTPPKTPSRRPSPSTPAFTVTPADPHISTSTTADSAGTSTAPHPSAFISPRCIPVHGTLRSMYCPSCSYSTSLSAHISGLSTGISPACPNCAELDTVRLSLGKRSRGIGRLRPSVVLYGEEHADGESVGECVRRDLVGLGDAGPGERARQGRRPDLLLVVGTSLSVPGIRRVVKEFSKAVATRPAGGEREAKAGPLVLPAASSEEEGMHADLDMDVNIFGAPDSPLTPLSDESLSPFSSAPSSPSPTPAPRQRVSALSKPAAEQSLPLPAIRTIYVNLEYPTPARDWEGVFDAWVQGDAQAFSAAVSEALVRLRREERRAELERVRREEERERQAVKKEEEKLRREEEARREEAEAKKRERAKAAMAKSKGKAALASKKPASKLGKMAAANSRPGSKSKSPKTKPVKKAATTVPISKFKAAPKSSWKPPLDRSSISPIKRSPMSPITPVKPKGQMRTHAMTLPPTPSSLPRQVSVMQGPQLPIITSSPTSPLRIRIRLPPGFLLSRPAAPVAPALILEQGTLDSTEARDESPASPKPQPTYSEYLRTVGLGLREKDGLSYTGMT